MIIVSASSARIPDHTVKLNLTYPKGHYNITYYVLRIMYYVLSITSLIVTLKYLFSNQLKLPSVPDVAWKVRRVVDREDSTALDVAKAVSADPAMAAKLSV